MPVSSGDLLVQSHNVTFKNYNVLLGKTKPEIYFTRTLVTPHLTAYKHPVSPKVISFQFARECTAVHIMDVPSYFTGERCDGNTCSAREERPKLTP